MTQHIDIKPPHRIETGKLQIGNDFPGYYIRSEDAIWLYNALSLLILELNDVPLSFPKSKARLLEDFIDELRKV